MPLYSNVEYYYACGVRNKLQRAPRISFANFSARDPTFGTLSALPKGSKLVHCAPKGPKLKYNLNIIDERKVPEKKRSIKKRFSR